MGEKYNSHVVIIYLENHNKTLTMGSHNRNLFLHMLKEELLIVTAHRFHALGNLLFLAFITSCLVSVSAPAPAALWI